MVRTSAAMKVVKRNTHIHTYTYTGSVLLMLSKKRVTTLEPAISLWVMPRNTASTYDSGVMPDTALPRGVERSSKYKTLSLPTSSMS